MTVLVTGATGYIGRRVVARLVSDGRSVRVLCRSRERVPRELARSTSVDVVVGDISDEKVVGDACAGVSTVLHLAAAMTGSREEFDRSTIEGTRVILEAAKRAQVRRLVYVSSMSVYDYSGLAVGMVVDEDTPLESHPESRDDYARTKRVAEAIVAESTDRDRLSVCIVRPGIVYGPNGRSPLIPVTSLRRLPRGRYLLVGGGRRQVPLVFVDNLVDALVRLLDSERAGGRTYNVIDANPPTEREYLRNLELVSGVYLKIVSVPTWAILPAAYAAELLRRLRRRGGMDIVHGLRRVTVPIRFDTSRLQRETGWASRLSLDDGMRMAFGIETVPATTQVAERVAS